MTGPAAGVGGATSAPSVRRLPASHKAAQQASPAAPVPALGFACPLPLLPNPRAVVETAQLLPDPAAAAAAAAGQWPEGEEPSKPRIVAVKRLKANILESEDDVFSFITEARLLIRLQHPSIVDYIGLGCEDASSQEAQWRTMYLVQEVGGLLGWC